MSMMAERDMGRILLDLSDDVIQRLDDLKVQRNIPRAELLREAVEQYLERLRRRRHGISTSATQGVVMTSGSALFDTNILIDLFSGRREAKQALEAWPPQNAISLITWMEVMVGAKKYHQEQRTRMALSTFNIINISQDIAERSVALRQEYKLKLPDAIILATAQLHRLELITRNTKDFAGIPGVVTPYEIHPE